MSSARSLQSQRGGKAARGNGVEARKGGLPVTVWHSVSLVSASCPQVMETWSVAGCINSSCSLCCASTAVCVASCWTRSQSLFPSPAVLSSRLIRACRMAAGTSVPTQPCGRHVGRSGGGGKWEEKVEAVLLLGMGIQPCTRLLGRNISSRCVTVAHCCCLVRLLCAELFLVHGS